MTSFAVPEGALEFWQRRLREHSVECREGRSAFDERALSLADPDGLQLEFVSSPDANPDRAWKDGPVPAGHAIRGFHHVTLSEEGYERTAALLTETLGFRLLASEGNRFRYGVSASGAGTIADVVCTPAGRAGRVSVGTVHHVAWRTPTDEQQLKWRDALRSYNVTPVIDRKYFHSIYFREPGGVLFEIATDPPGFAIDEPADALGTTCCYRRGWSLHAGNWSPFCPKCACPARRWAERDGGPRRRLRSSVRARPGARGRHHTPAAARHGW